MQAVLGIDVSKNKLNTTLLAMGKAKNKTCSNNSEGIAELLGWLKRQGSEIVHACMEATGRYGDLVAEALVDAGHKVSVVNPARIVGFAKSELLRTKCDAVDAGLIARFCAAMQPEAWTPLPREVQELRALVKHLADLEEAKLIQENRIEGGCASPAVTRSIEAIISQLSHEIDETKRLIDEHFEVHEALKAQRDLLTSIPGIGKKTAGNILAEIRVLSQFKNARQLAAFAGLTPRERTSGTSVKGRSVLSKVGSSRLRKYLYFPAIAALKFNPLIRELAARMLAAGKAKMQVVGAAMRKLLHFAFGVLKSGKPFAPNYLQVSA